MFQPATLFHPPGLLRSARLFALATVILVGGLQMPLMAQDAEDEAPLPELMKKPIATIAVAGVERLRGDIKYLFETAGRTDIYEQMESGLETIGNLKGMDQTKPFGAMVYLRAGFPPAPEVVGFVPVDNIEELSKTLEIGPVVTKKLDDTHYEIIGMRGEFQVKLQNGYAFISTKADVVETEFPDPARSTRGITSKFDIGATLNLDAIPVGMRDLFMNFVKAQANADMQQRDDEPDGVYKIRRSQSEGMLQGLTQTMAELESLTIGIDANQEKSQVAFEIVMDAQEDSKLAKEMKRINGKTNYFEPLITEEAPMTLSVSLPIEEKDMERTKDMITGMELMLASELTEDVEGAVLPPQLAGMMEALRDTVDDGHINMFLQFYGEPGAFSIVGGMRLTGARSVGVGIKDMLERLSEDIDAEIGTVELDAESHNEVAFHRIAAKDAGEAKKAFGDDVALYVGADTRTLWFSAGGDAAFEKTTELMDIMAAPKDPNRKRTRKAPFRLIFNIRQWLGLDEDGEGLMFDAFEEGGDRVTVDLQPTDDGMRVRAQADEGFMRLIGMGIGSRMDRRRNRNGGGGRGGRPDGSQ